MSVYRVEAAKASCGVSGCACRGRTRCYPSDLTDEQRQVLEPQAGAVMAELRKSPAGAPMRHDLRAVLDAIGYLTRYGIEWRALPVDFPPWEAVYAFFERWSERDLPRRLADRLRGRIRIAAGRAELPTAAVIDAQTVRGADTVTAATAGYDAGKKTKGRKRNIATDCLGLVLMVTVTAAGMQDRDNAGQHYERRPEHHEAMGLVGHRHHHDPPPHPRTRRRPATTTLGPAQTTQPNHNVIIYQQALRSAAVKPSR
jgi:transposase